MKIDLLSDYRPNAGQRRFHASSAAFKCGLAGIGGGKSKALAVESLLLALANPGCTGVIAGPTHAMLVGSTMESFRDSLPRPEGCDRPWGSPLVRDWSAREMCLTLAAADNRSRRGSARIRFRSAHDPEHLRGPNLAWFALDEAALCRRQAWEVLIGRVRVRDARRAAGIAVTTPRGFDWVYEEFAGGSDAGSRLIRWSTADNAGNLRPGFVEELRAAYPDRLARQELDAAFESFHGAVYADFRRTAAPDGNLLPWTYRPDRPTWLGIDFGFRRPAAVWVQELPVGETLVPHALERQDCRSHPDRSHPDRSHHHPAFVVFDEFVPADCPTDRLIAGIRARPYRLSGAFGDPAGAGVDGSGGSDLAALRAAGIPVRVCTDAVRTRLMYGIGLLQGLVLDATGRRRLFLATDESGRCRVPTLLAALEGYAWPSHSPGRPLRDEPLKDGVHDHPLDALRYWAINHLPAAAGGLAGSTGRR
jgi:hypothetical protein